MIGERRWRRRRRRAVAMAIDDARARFGVLGVDNGGLGLGRV